MCVAVVVGRAKKEEIENFSSSFSPFSLIKPATHFYCYLFCLSRILLSLLSLFTYFCINFNYSTERILLDDKRRKFIEVKK
jgi:hypothetical protein